MEEARQYPAVTLVRNVALGVVLASLSASVFAIVKSAATPDHLYSSGKTIWAASDTTWAELFGARRVHIKLDIYRNEIREIAYDDAFLLSLCGNVLVNLPNPPEPDATATSLYRIDLDLPQGDTMTGERVTMPVGVVQGKCRLARYDTLYYPSFPPPLDGWIIFNGKVSEEANGRRLILSFRRLPGAPETGESLPYQRACEAALNEQVDLLQPMFGKPDWTKLGIRSERRIGNDLVHFTTYEQENFVIANSTCAPDPEGKAP